MGGDAQVVAALASSMGDADAGVRRHAARSLARVAKVGDEQVLNILLRSMEESDSGAWHEAMDALELLADRPEDREKIAIWRRHFVAPPSAPAAGPEENRKAHRNMNPLSLQAMRAKEI